MIAENHLRGIMILVALSVLGCAPSVGRVEPTLSSAHPIPTPGCPYANVYVAVSTDGSTKDKRIAERVRLAYSEFLGEQGFSVAAAPEEAYWSAFSMVHLSPRIDSTFAWTVYVMATQDLQGRIQTPIDFSGEGEGETELSGFMLLREVQLLELDLQAQQAAADTGAGRRRSAQESARRAEQGDHANPPGEDEEATAKGTRDRGGRAVGVVIAVDAGIGAT
jgi:hypothetical protein